MTEKTAVLAPIPSASVTSVAAAKPLLRRMVRRASRASATSVSSRYVGRASRTRSRTAPTLPNHLTTSPTLDAARTPVPPPRPAWPTCPSLLYECLLAGRNGRLRELADHGELLPLAETEKWQRQESTARVP